MCGHGLLGCGTPTASVQTGARRLTRPFRADLTSVERARAKARAASDAEADTDQRRGEARQKHLKSSSSNSIASGAQQPTSELAGGSGIYRSLHAPRNPRTPFEELEAHPSLLSLPAELLEDQILDMLSPASCAGLAMYCSTLRTLVEAPAFTFSRYAFV